MDITHLMDLFCKKAEPFTQMVKDLSNRFDERTCNISFSRIVGTPANFVGVSGRILVYESKCGCIRANVGV